MAANLTFGGPRRNRLFVTATNALHSVFVATSVSRPPEWWISPRSRGIDWLAGTPPPNETPGVNHQREVKVNGDNTILIVDDDELLCDSLVEQFSLHDEFSAIDARTAAEGIKALKQNLVALVILDVNLPDMDGREACKMMRRNGYAGPVIMLTAQDSEADTVLGLDSGANDYVAKPFKFAVLLARIRAHLRQHEHSEAAVYRIGPYVFRPSARLLIGEGERKVRLTEKEASILKHLYRAGEQVVDRDALLRDVWGYSPGVTTHTVETHVYRLRQKIEADPSRARILVTENSGYRLRP
jgi:DNA-binding response OmpR family regulator